MKRAAVAMLVLLMMVGQPAGSAGAAPQPQLSDIALSLVDLPPHFEQKTAGGRPAYMEDDALLEGRGDTYAVSYERLPQVGIVSVNVQLGLWQSHARAQAVAFAPSEHGTPVSLMTTTALTVGNVRVGQVFTDAGYYSPCKMQLYGVVQFTHGPYSAIVTADYCTGKLAQALPMRAQRQIGASMLAHLAQWGHIMEARMARVKHPKVLDLYPPLQTNPPRIFGGQSSGVVEKNGRYSIFVYAYHGATCIALVTFSDGTNEVFPKYYIQATKGLYDEVVWHGTLREQHHGVPVAWVDCSLGGHGEAVWFPPQVQ